MGPGVLENAFYYFALFFDFRFNLLLLEPGEIYLEDFSVYYYPRGSQSLLENSAR